MLGFTTAGTATAGVGAAATVALGIAAVVGAVVGTGYVASELSGHNTDEARRLATPRGAEDASMRAYRREQGDGSLDADIEDARAEGAVRRFIGPHPPEQNSVGWFKSFDNWIVENFPSMKVNTAGIAAGGGNEVSISGTPDVSIPNPVTTQPSGTQDVRVTNPTPAPVINVTVNAQTNADPAQIARQTTDAISAELNALSRGAYSDGAN